MQTLTIERRYRGPATSGNGGWVAGCVARAVGGDAVEVTLRSPAPLDTELELSREGERVTLTHDGTLIAEGSPTTVELELPRAPSFDEAQRVARPMENHALPECFVCGPARDDGLKLFPAALGEVVAAPLVLDEPSLELTWAALDCPSGIALWALAGWEGPMLLGRIAARIVTPLQPRARHVVVGWVRSVEGRKGHTASAIFDEGGRPLAFARAIWIRPVLKIST